MAPTTRRKAAAAEAPKPSTSLLSEESEEDSFRSALDEVEKAANDSNESDDVFMDPDDILSSVQRLPNIGLPLDEDADVQLSSTAQIAAAVVQDPNLDDSDDEDLMILQNPCSNELLVLVDHVRDAYQKVYFLSNAESDEIFDQGIQIYKNTVIKVIHSDDDDLRKAFLLAVRKRTEPLFLGNKPQCNLCLSLLANVATQLLFDGFSEFIFSFDAYIKTLAKIQNKVGLASVAHYLAKMLEFLSAPPDNSLAAEQERMKLFQSAQQILLELANSKELEVRVATINGLAVLRDAGVRMKVKSKSVTPRQMLEYMTLDQSSQVRAAVARVTNLNLAGVDKLANAICSDSASEVVCEAIRRLSQFDFRDIPLVTKVNVLYSISKDDNRQVTECGQSVLFQTWLRRIIEVENSSGRQKTKAEFDGILQAILVILKEFGANTLWTQVPECAGIIRFVLKQLYISRGSPRVAVFLSDLVAGISKSDGVIIKSNLARRLCSDIDDAIPCIFLLRALVEFAEDHEAQVDLFEVFNGILPPLKDACAALNLMIKKSDFESTTVVQNDFLDMDDEVQRVKYLFCFAELIYIFSFLDREAVGLQEYRRILVRIISNHRVSCFLAETAVQYYTATFLQNLKLENNVMVANVWNEVMALVERGIDSYYSMYGKVRPPDCSHLDNEVTAYVFTMCFSLLKTGYFYTISDTVDLTLCKYEHLASEIYKEAAIGELLSLQADIAIIFCKMVTIFATEFPATFVSYRQLLPYLLTEMRYNNKLRHNLLIGVTDCALAFPDGYEKYHSVINAENRDITTKPFNLIHHLLYALSPNGYEKYALKGTKEAKQYELMYFESAAKILICAPRTVPDLVPLCQILLAHTFHPSHIADRDISALLHTCFSIFRTDPKNQMILMEAMFATLELRHKYRTKFTVSENYRKFNNDIDFICMIEFCVYSVSGETLFAIAQSDLEKKALNPDYAMRPWVPGDPNDVISSQSKLVRHVYSIITNSVDLNDANYKLLHEQFDPDSATDNSGRLYNQHIRMCCETLKCINLEFGFGDENLAQLLSETRRVSGLLHESYGLGCNCDSDTHTAQCAATLVAAFEKKLETLCKRLDIDDLQSIPANRDLCSTPSRLQRKRLPRFLSKSATKRAVSTDRQRVEQIIRQQPSSTGTTPKKAPRPLRKARRLAIPSIDEEIESS